MKRKASIALSLLLAAGTALTPSVPVVAAPHINPYGRVEAELQFSREVKEEITEENGTTAVSLESGNYFSASTISFSKGVSQIGIRLKADGPGIIVIHKGDTDGDDVGNIKYKATDGYEDFTVSVKDLGDADQLTFVNKVGSCYVDSWIAEPGETAEEPVDQPDTPDVPDVPDTPDQPEVPDTPDQPEVPDQPQQPVSSGLLNPYEKVEVENTSRGLTGAMVTPSKNAIMITDGGYILVQDIDFSEGLSGFKVQASGTGDSAKLNVYLDSDPSPIGSVTVGNDISKETSIEVSTSATGKHYLYFEAKGGAVTIDAWKAVKASGTVEQPPVEEQPVEEPPVGDTVNPYTKVEAEAASEITQGRVTPSKNAVAMMDGGYVITKNVDFSNGLSGFAVYAQASAPKVKLNVYMDGAKSPIGSINLGTDMTKASMLKLSSNLTGKHDVYFQAEGGNVTFDAWNAMKGQGTVTPPVEEPPVGDTVNPYATVEAETASEVSGAMVTPKKDAVNILKANGYAVIKNVNFSKGVSEFKVNTSAKAAGVLEIKLDGADKENVATVRLDQTDAFKSYTVKALKEVTGTHDVYLVVKVGTGVSIDSWSATEASGTVEQPPVVEPPVGDTVNPYEKVEAEDSAVKTNAKVAPNKQSVVINDGGYVAAKNVDFSKGLSGFQVYASSTKPTVKLNVYIDEAGYTGKKPVGTVNVGASLATGSGLKLTSALTGTHDVYFEAVGGTVTFDAWNAVAGQGTVVDPPVEEPPVGDTVDPYTTVEAEASAEVKNAMVAPNKQSVVINADGYMVAKNVNFAQGISGIFVSAKAAQPKTTIAVYIDKVAGDPIGTITIGSMGEFKEAGARLTTDLTGTHDVYFVAKGGAATVDTWHAMKGQGTVTPPVVEPPVGDTVNPYEKVEAEDSADKSGAMVAPNKQTVVINKNGYVVAKNVDLSKGLKDITVKAGATAASRLEVRLDKVDGERIAMFMVGNEAKELKFNTSATVTGTHDLYFVDTMDGSITFDYWVASPADGTVVTPPVGGGTNPYEKIEAETTPSTNFTDAVLAPGSKSVVINPNGYIRIDNLDFSKGVSAFKAYTKSSKPMTKLNVYIDETLVGTVDVGTDMAKETVINVSSSATGKHYIYFEAKNGAVTLDAWQAVDASGTVVTPPASESINPYNKIEAESTPKENYTSAMLAPSKQAVVINNNGYILIQNIDFSKGLSGFAINAQASAPKVKLNVYIDDSNTPIGTMDVGVDMTKTTYMKLPSGTNVTGNHYIYIEAKGGNVTLDAWQAMAAGSAPIDQPPVVEPPVYEDINPYNKVEAETIPSASYTNAMLTPSKQAVSIMKGGNVVAKNVVFSNGVSEFKVTAGSTASAKLEVRLGSATGTLLGSANISGDAKEYTIKSSQNLSGKKDIYFVSTNGVISFDSWKVTEYKEPVVTPPPVVETGVKASYKENSWNDGYQLNFTVTNSSGKTINSWKVKVKKSDINVSQSWCVNVSQEGDYYVFTPMSYNSTLANGQSTEFGMIGRGQVGSSISYTVE